MKAATRPRRIKVGGVLCVRGEHFLLMGAPKATPNHMKRAAKARRYRKAAAVSERPWRETMAKFSPYRDEMDKFFKRFGLQP